MHNTSKEQVAYIRLQASRIAELLASPTAGSADQRARVREQLVLLDKAAEQIQRREGI